jgi:hypothetical protein
VLGFKYTLVKDINLGPVGTSNVRLYGGADVEGDIPNATGAPSCFGGFNSGGGLLLEWNSLKKKLFDAPTGAANDER